MLKTRRRLSGTSAVVERGKKQSPKSNQVINSSKYKPLLDSVTLQNEKKKLFLDFFPILNTWSTIILHQVGSIHGLPSHVPTSLSQVTALTIPRLNLYTVAGDLFWSTKFLENCFDIFHSFSSVTSWSSSPASQVSFLFILNNFSQVINVFVAILPIGQHCNF